MDKLKKVLEKALKSEPLFADPESGELNYIKVKDSADKIDEKLISLLVGNNDLKNKFFTKIKDVYVFNIQDFKFFLDESKVDNSYTQYENKIGLSDNSGLLENRSEVVLDFPFKDCVLEGGQSTEEGTDTYFEYSDKNGKYEEKTAKRNEIFFNQVLAHDEIDRLFDRKALINWKRFTKDSKKDGEAVKEIKRDKTGLIQENLIIKGNNLLALHSLKSEFAGKIKLIYIDPPYYFKDIKADDAFAYNSNFKLSTWLTFMKNRLDIAKELLRDDGFLLVQIKEDGHSHLKLLLDSVFNGQIVNDIVVKMSESSGIKMSHVEKKLPNVKEYILFYKKNIKSNLYPVKLNKADNGNKLKDYLKYYTKVITNPDEEVENWKIESIDKYLTKKGIKPSKKEIEDFQTQNAERVVYRTNNASFKGLKIDKQITKIISKTGLEYIWWEGKQMLFLSDYINEYVCDLWTDISTINLNKEGGVDFQNGKKPEELIERILKLTTKDNDIVLDYHSGSGTTACVAQKMKRQWIVIEQIDSQIKLSLERVKNVINGDSSGISKSVNWKGGGEFIYCELAKWNEKAKEEIQNAKDLPALVKLFDTLYEKYFLNYNVKIKDFKDKIVKEENFKKLTLAQQKKMFLTMLDLNQMYVQESEMADKKYGISSEDQKLTKAFYSKK